MKIDPDSPQVVAECLTEHEAALLINHLKEQGIDAHAWGARTAALHGEAGFRENVTVVVRQSDVERARKTCEEFRRGGS